MVSVPPPLPEYGRVEGLDLVFHGTPLTSMSGLKVSVWSWLVPPFPFMGRGGRVFPILEGEFGILD